MNFHEYQASVDQMKKWTQVGSGESEGDLRRKLESIAMQASFLGIPLNTIARKSLEELGVPRDE